MNEDEINREAIINDVDAVYQDECNRGRYAGAMRIALRRYEKLMKEIMRQKMQPIVSDWEKEMYGK